MDELLLLQAFKRDALVVGRISVKELTDHVERRVAECLFGEAHAAAVFGEEVPIGLAFAQRFDHLFADLHVPAVVVADHVVGLKLRRGGQHEVAVLHAVGHDHVKAHDEEVVALQVFNHLVDVGRDGDRVAVVEDQHVNRLDRTAFRGRILREQRVIKVGHVHVLRLALDEVVAATDVEVHARDRTHVVIDDAAARLVEHAAQGVHDADGARHAGAVVVALHAVAAADDATLGLAVDFGELLNLGALDAGHAFDVLPLHRINLREDGFGSNAAVLEEVVINHFVVREEILHHAHGDPGIGAGIGLQPDVGLRADRRAVRVDGKHLAAVVAAHVDVLDAVHVRDGFVEAPRDVAVAGRNFLGIRTVGRALHGAVAPDAGFGADDAVKNRGAQTVEEAVGAAHADGAVVTRIRVGQNSLGAVGVDHFVRLLDELGPGFFPGDAAPLVRALGPDAFHGVQDAVGGVGVLNIGETLHARAGAGLELLLSTRNVGHAAVLNAELHQATVGAVAQTAVVLQRAGTLVEEDRIGTDGVHGLRCTRNQAGQ